MNILISTTTNWNVGDDFIRMGVRHLLDEIYPDANYIHYDRNPNNFISFPDNQTPKKYQLGNIMTGTIDWESIDLVVLAGSPEFLHEPLQPIYEGLLTRTEIPLWAIGVGYTYPQLLKRLTVAEKTVLCRPTTKIIVRQHDLKKILSEQGVTNEINVLPCPAIFCNGEYGSKHTKDTLYIIDENNVPLNGSIATASIDFFKSNKKIGLFFDSDPYRFLNKIRQYKKVYSHRLHGAIAALSCGACVDCMGVDYRIKAAIELFNPILQCTDRYKILYFKTETKQQYLKILTA
jgi:hypothetical protein